MISSVTARQLYPEDLRTWTDVKGRQIDAYFDSASSGVVVIIRRSDNTRFEFPYDNLSQSDKDFIAAAPQWRPPAVSAGIFWALNTYCQALDNFASSRRSNSYNPISPEESFRVWAENQFGSLGITRLDVPKSAITKLYEAGMQDVNKLLEGAGIAASELNGKLVTGEVVKKLYGGITTDSVLKARDAVAERIKAHDNALSHQQTLSGPAFGLLNMPPAPTKQDVATNAGGKCWVGIRGEHVCIKHMAKSSADSVATLQFGELLTVMQRDGLWFKVKTKEGKEGWIHDMAVCDEATLQARKSSGRIPSAMLLVSGFDGTTDACTVDILAGVLRVRAEDDKPVASAGNCVVFVNSPGLEKASKFGLFQNAAILNPKADVIYYFGDEGRFVPLSDNEAQLTSQTAKKAADHPVEPHDVLGGDAVPKNWPAMTGELLGGLEVRVRNPNEFKVKVALRSGGKGKDFSVGANGVEAVFVPNGRFDIYFQYSTDPDGLYQGDSFTLGNNGVEIQIVKVVNGNYGIRKVQ